MICSVFVFRRDGLLCAVTVVVLVRLVRGRCSFVVVDADDEVEVFGCIVVLPLPIFPLIPVERRVPVLPRPVLVVAVVDIRPPRPLRRPPRNKLL